MFSWVLFAPVRGALERAYTFKTLLPGFLLASETGGDDIIVTGDRWRGLQVGNRPEISRILPNLVSTSYPEFGPQGHLCLSGGWGLTPSYVLF